MSASLTRTEAPQHAARSDDTIRVWDPLVRIFHWTVVLGVLLNSFLMEGGKAPHRYVGYAVAAALAIRIAWGFVGSVHARFSDFLASPRMTVSHVRAVMAGRDRRYLGHNPAGAAMIVALMILLGVTTLTGWMQGLDAFWGVEWVQETHEICANLIIAMAAMHVLGAIFESLAHRENLVLSMITGRKRGASGTDVDHAAAARGG